MIRSLYSGVSGLQAHGTAIDVVADNIANVNTPGFKAARAQFQALVAQTLRAAGTPDAGGQNPAQVGLGVTVGAIERQMTQGSPQTTGRASDLAIEGNGYFIISTGAGAPRYTRNGAFDINGNRQLVEAASGAAVLGWVADANGKIDTSQPITPLTIPAEGDTLARQTTKLTLSGNLDATANVGDSASTTVRLYDSQGREQYITFTMVKTAPNTWSWDATDAGGASVGTGVLTFDGEGRCTTGPATVSVPLTDGAITPMVFTTTFNVQQLAESSEVVASHQDGLPPGAYQGFSVTDNGVLIGSYSNGLTRQIGQLAIASFTNPAGLQRGPAGAFLETANSGPAQVGTSGTGGEATSFPGRSRCRMLT